MGLGFLPVWALLVLASPSDAAQASLEEDRGWPAGTIQAQLDRDPKLVPFGFGAVFVPAMTNPLDEPPVTIWSGPTRVMEGTTGSRLIVYPGTYEVRLGTGTGDQRLAIQVTVKEQQVTVVPASWSGLAVHVVDEQFGSVRSSYEIIRADGREYMGIGFGTDEQAGEPVSTWVLRPGLYKIVRVGETYRARRDFATVRLREGRFTHFLLVVDPATGDFSGGGEVPEAELFRPTGGFFGSLVVGGDLTLSSRRGDPTVGDGLGFAFRGFADGRLSVELLKSPLVLQMQIEEGQTKSPGQPLSKTNDRADLDLLYV
ncbi:MAG: hypothetical protein IPK13_16655 [Deltaproteobacteria bacterium]|nr:hypothetical protein [Deltaproteobacteria bacterium]